MSPRTFKITYVITDVLLRIFLLYNLRENVLLIKLCILHSLPYTSQPRALSQCLLTKWTYWAFLRYTVYRKLLICHFINIFNHETIFLLSTYKYPSVLRKTFWSTVVQIFCNVFLNYSYMWYYESMYVEGSNEWVSKLLVQTERVLRRNHVLHQHLLGEITANWMLKEKLGDWIMELGRAGGRWAQIPRVPQSFVWSYTQ